MSELAATMNPANSIQSRNVRHADLHLMNRIAAGDEAAFGHLVRQHGTALATTIARLTLWNSDSDDIFQEVLISIWQKAGQYDGRGPLEGWLKRIAINRCQNQFRLRDSIRRKLENFAEWLGGRRTTANETSTEEDATSRVRDALARLTSDDRTILVLFYLEEMTGQEVSNVLKISVDAVHVRLHRARKRLRKILNDEATNLL